jgi:Raf kinase inhibitor-like YbhB/YbcL family protein
MSNGYIHWAVWDIPPTARSLPAALPDGHMITTPAGAKQVSYLSNRDGYFGPCPSGQTHTYVFQVFALNVATLPTLSASSTTEAVRTQIMMSKRSLATGTLSGTSDARN